MNPQNKKNNTPTLKDDKTSLYLGTYEIEKLKIARRNLKHPADAGNHQSAVYTIGDNNKNSDLPLPPVSRNHQSIKPFPLQSLTKLVSSKSNVIEEVNSEEKMMEVSLSLLITF